MKKLSLKNTGFTLIELMVAIAIVAILLTIAIPSFREMIMNNRLSMRTNNFVDIIQFARSEAIRVGEVVIVDAGGGSANEWGQGVTVWHDVDNNGSMAASEVLRVLEAFNSGVTLDSEGFNEIQFQPTGETNLAGAEQLDLCDGRSGETGREIEILVTGLIRVITLDCS